MKVSELLGKLSQVDPNFEVCLQLDEEGNGYNILRGIEISIHGQESDTWYDPHWSADDCCLETEKWEAIKKNKTLLKVVLLP